MSKNTIFLSSGDDLQGAFDNAGPGDIIQLSEGEYRTKCTIFVPEITIRGEGPDKTVIVWDDYAEKIHEDGTIYLARPWQDYGLSRFENCSYGPHINPLGFDKWNDTDRDRTARFYETPVRPGRVKWVK